ncbi:jg23276 [Pararge aegeria aegeria]|uniref:Jg23276 protein n=1 Tax=Pararge aegeria aegeria TaxID=348720 RepID=A0A8S4QQF4_9NEOP|nr:jg23276 [Pararge aegeria aegeria]
MGLARRSTDSSKTTSAGNTTSYATVSRPKLDGISSRSHTRHGTKLLSSARVLMRARARMRRAGACAVRECRVLSYHEGWGGDDHEHRGVRMRIRHGEVRP